MTKRNIMGSISTDEFKMTLKFPREAITKAVLLVVWVHEQTLGMLIVLKFGLIKIVHFFLLMH